MVLLDPWVLRGDFAGQEGQMRAGRQQMGDGLRIEEEIWIVRVDRNARHVVDSVSSFQHDFCAKRFISGRSVAKVPAEGSSMTQSVLRVRVG